MIVVLNLRTWQNSDAGCMMLPGRNMLSALLYSPHVGLTSYLCELDINPSLFGNKDVSLTMVQCFSKISQNQLNL